MVHQPASSLLGMESLTIVNKKVFNRVLCERRLMAACTLGTLVGVVLLLISAGTCSWAIVEVAAPHNLTEKLFLGIWGEWQVLYNESRELEGRRHC
ncbi:unnamed protein product [Soboliphyme baturini]|uniref:Col_cuticle_N domain-containing protein n=1 Tax=Soboliphyme baturini TaxID=241478 RepID=A0A183J1A0_9BILA|nr:unnamed protein product [Soboliphyme baturini]